jgi:hypothetical protein
LYKKIVPIIAIVIPAAATRFPLLAVAGLDNIFSPIINVTEPMR